jgi:hypothetical protein
MYCRWNIDINGALDIASRSKEVALKTRDPDDMALAESTLGAANHLAGNLPVALKHFESGLSHSASSSRFRAGQYLFHHSSLLLRFVQEYTGLESDQFGSLVSGLYEELPRSPQILRQRWTIFGESVVGLTFAQILAIELSH